MRFRFQDAYGRWDIFSAVSIDVAIDYAKRHKKKPKGRSPSRESGLFAFSTRGNPMTIANALKIRAALLRRAADEKSDERTRRERRAARGSDRKQGCGIRAGVVGVPRRRRLQCAIG
jgi:hypothetical protein